MPYVFVEELGEGQEAVDVRSVDEYNALEIELDTAVGARDELQHSYDELVNERDSLAAELDDAKTKFANAFLSSPQKAKENNSNEMKHEEKPQNFKSLFTGRNKSNAN